MNFTIGQLVMYGNLVVRVREIGKKSITVEWLHNTGSRQTFRIEKVSHCHIKHLP